MSYTKTFAGLAGTAAAVVMAAQVASAEPSQNTLLHDAQFAPMSVSNDIVPPEIRPFIGDLNVSFDFDIDFEGGTINVNSTDISLTDIECDFIEPIFEDLDAQDIATNEFYGIERTAEEQQFVNSVRELFQNRVSTISESFTAQDIIEMAGEENAFFLPADLPERTSIRVHMECSDYVAPEPSFTPVEPN